MQKLQGRFAKITVDFYQLLKYNELNKDVSRNH